MSENKISEELKNEYYKKLELYHFEAYKKLIVTLIGLNTSGIGGIIAYIGIFGKNACPKNLLNYLEYPLLGFSIGLLLIFSVVFIEYFLFFFFKELDPKIQETCPKKARTKKIKLIKFIIFKRLTALDIIQLVLIFFSSLSLVVSSIAVVWSALKTLG